MVKYQVYKLLKCIQNVFSKAINQIYKFSGTRPLASIVLCVSRMVVIVAAVTQKTALML